MQFANVLKFFCWLRRINKHGIIDLNVVPEDMSGDWATYGNANIVTEETVQPASERNDQWKKR